MNHLIFDVETLGRYFYTPVIQIGAVVFNKTGIQRTFIRNVGWDDLDNYNFRVTYDTIKWWMKQNDDARNSVTTGDVSTLKEIMRQFNIFLNNEEHIHWCHKDFDGPILKSLYRETGVIDPRKYWNIKDIRTLELVSSVEKPKGFKGIKHSALDDCVFFAEWIIDMLNDINFKW